jgi:hypothetical protein
MDVGIGLPVLCLAPDMPVTAWARRAEERGFTSLGTIDRLGYDYSGSARSDEAMC